MATATQLPLSPGKLLIGGEWVAAAEGKTFSTINPATEEAVAELARAGKADADRAVEAAHAALSGAWGKMSAAERGRLLWRLAEKMREKADDLALLEACDVGKPVSEVKHVDVQFAADTFEYFGGWSSKLHGDTIPVRGNNFNYTLREPLGVVACIVPWNFPLLMASWKVAAALSVGNTVVLKPSSTSPLTALKLGELALEVGFPAGVLNVVTGPGGEVGDALVRHPLVDKVTFTGEVETGKSIMRLAADGMKSVTMELGGKSPNVVFADADLEAAVRGVIGGIFYNKGEVCAAGSRLLVEESVHDEFLEKLVARASKMVPGDPLDPKTRLGPLASRSQLEKISGYVETGTREGAKLACGGQRVDIGTGKGYFFQPTIFDGVTNQMTIAREEIFGPVLSTLVFKDLEEAISLGNDSPFGLAAGVWTRDIKKAHRAARALRAGTVWVNTYNVYDPASPFGGYKFSGFGRELGAAALESYTRVKSVWVGLD